MNNFKQFIKLVLEKLKSSKTTKEIKRLAIDFDEFIDKILF